MSAVTPVPSSPSVDESTEMPLAQRTQPAVADDDRFKAGPSQGLSACLLLSKSREPDGDADRRLGHRAPPLPGEDGFDYFVPDSLGVAEIGQAAIDLVFV
jgi:hypothetical protein